MMRIIFITNKPRKGAAILKTDAGLELERVECWAHTHQGRALTTKHLEHLKNKNTSYQNEKTSFTITTKK